MIQTKVQNKKKLEKRPQALRPRLINSYQIFLKNLIAFSLSINNSYE